MSERYPRPSFETPALDAPLRAVLDHTLDALVSGIQTALGPNLVGVYLVGSFALGAADASSDLDFLAVTAEPPTPAEQKRLHTLHEFLPDGPAPWSQHLEGSYAPHSQLAASPASTAAWLYVDNGSRTLERSDHDDTATMRWVLREHGIALVGPPASTLLGPIAPDALRREASTRALAWQQFLRDEPETVDNAWAQTHFTTGFCRLLFTTAFGTVTSKQHATDWALRVMDAAWSPLLEQALRDRPLAWQRLALPADPALARQTLAFADAIAARTLAPPKTGDSSSGRPQN